ncbi:MAG: SDR family NAD(P)-dependent oxidoreductase [Desulfatiglandales bacterium]
MEEMDLNLTGRVALVTGGSHGLGKAVARAMAEKNARVIVCARKQEGLDEIVEEFRRHRLELAAYSADVGENEQVTALFENIRQDFGRLDILVNNVGTNIFTPSVAEATEELWDKTMQSSLKSAFLTSAGAVPLMKGQGGGRIINMSSIAARKAAPGMGLYCIAKAGLEMLTKVLAVELAGGNINVNAVAPGMIRTRFSKPLWSNEKMLKDYLQRVPMGRIAETSEVVGAVLFLASGLSDYITGEIITVDGGSMA